MRPPVECPQCHAAATYALGKPYCPRCGWNREAAEKRTRQILRAMPLLVVAFDAPLIIWILTGHAQLSTLTLLFLLALSPALLMVLVVRSTYMKVSAAPAAAGATPGAAPAAAASGAPNEAVAKTYALLLELPRPRPVRMSRRGKTAAIILTVAMLGFAAMLVVIAGVQWSKWRKHAAADPQIWVFSVLLVGVTLTALAMQRGLARERRLLSEGEVALARVGRQWYMKNGSNIQYEFATPTGETIKGRANDFSRQLFEGMTVPVFYDAQNPRRKTALCGSFYEVEMPGQS